MLSPLSLVGWAEAAGYEVFHPTLSPGSYRNSVVVST